MFPLPTFISDLRAKSLPGSTGSDLCAYVLSSRGLSSLALFIGALLLSGCGNEEEITTYRVPKPHVVHRSNPPAQDEVKSSRPASMPAVPARMLGAVVPGADKTWFFKLTGNPDAVEKIASDFETFIQSIKMTDGVPTWTTPAGWQQLADDDPKNGGIFPRLATLMIPSEEDSLELAVTTLNGDGGGLLSNINRWRGQMALSPLADIKPSDELKQIPVGDKTATLVNLLGETRSRSMSGRPPFASGSPPKLPSRTPSDPPKAPLTYTAPEGWTEGKGNIFSVAAFQVTDGSEKSIDITITPAGGDPLSNINRWRGQISLKPLSEAELNSELKTIDVDGVQASYVELIGPETSDARETILGVLAQKSGTTWFIKLKGDSELAAREKDNFETFVRSIRFSKTDEGR